MKTILEPYPSEVYKIIPISSYEDLELMNLRHIGNIQRYFNPKEVNFNDLDVAKFISSREENLADYSHYAVVPKRLSIARKSILRYARSEDPFTPQVKAMYDIAGSWLEKEFGPYLANSVLISYGEVLEWLHPDKSPGLPWTFMYQFKMDFWNSIHADFYCKYWESLSTLNYVRSLCSVTIKEEVRTREKVENDDGRTIVCMDVNHVVAHCQITLRQNQALIASVGKHSSSLGLNTLAGGFHKLNDRMEAHGAYPATIALDGKKFDGRFRRYCMEKIADFRWKMLREMDRTPDNKRRMNNLYKELTHAPLVNVDGRVYSRHAGNPSGQACTTPDNTFKNFMDICVLWLLLSPPEDHSYESFKKHLILCICGDDINISVHIDAQGYFNYPAIQKIMNEIDMEYHVESEVFKFNHELTFLGHAWRMVDIPSLGHGMYLPVIDCCKMRSNMLIYNKDQTRALTIVRACGLRNETFACEDCRHWFLELINFLRDLYRGDESPEIVEAWKNYLTDYDLWKLFSGCESTALAKHQTLESIVLLDSLLGCENRGDNFDFLAQSKESDYRLQSKVQNFKRSALLRTITKGAQQLGISAANAKLLKAHRSNTLTSHKDLDRAIAFEKQIKTLKKTTMARKSRAQRRAKAGRRRNQVMKSTRSRPKMRGRAKRGRLGLQPRLSASTVQMPVNIGNITSGGPMMKTRREHFNSGILRVFTDSASQPYFATSGNPASIASQASAWNMDLHPSVNNVDFQSSIFGTGISKLGTIYSRYRIPSFRVTYISNKGSTDAGTIGFCYNSDPGLNIGSSVSGNTSGWADLNSHNMRKSGPVAPLAVPWFLDVDIKGLYRSRKQEQPWLYTSKSSLSTTVAEQREDFAGALCVATLGGLVATQVYASCIIEGDIEFAELDASTGVTGAVTAGHNPALAVPDMAGNTTSGTSSLAAPFDATNSPLNFTSTTQQVGFPNTSVIRFGKVLLADGIWRVRLTATDAVGTITVGFSISLSNAGTGLSNSYSSSSSSAPPYSYQNIIGIYGTGASANYVDATVSGPTTMTAGNVQFDILKISGSAGVGATPSIEKPLSCADLWGTEYDKPSIEDDSPVVCYAPRDEYGRLSKAVRLNDPLHALGVSVSSPPIRK